METQKSNEVKDKKYISKVKLCIRRVEGVALPGEDVSAANVKIGASLNGTAPLKGLSYIEEVKYLPEIIGYSPNDTDWRKVIKEYWNNISVLVPADGETVDELQGKVLEFTLAFSNNTTKEAFENEIEFEKQIVILKQAEIDGGLDVVEGVSDYVLFRYCAVYGRVANSSKDIRKSPKIRFYLHSKRNEIKYAHKSFKLRTEASAKFTSILDDEKIINSLLLLFKQDLSIFHSLEDKHLVLETFVKTKPKEFLLYANDSTLPIKALITRGVSQGVINNPSNTEAYYYGEGNEVLLGTSLTNTVLYFKSKEESNREIIEAIKAQIKNT